MTKEYSHVIPAQAGIQVVWRNPGFLDSRFRGNDGLGTGMTG